MKRSLHAWRRILAALTLLPSLMILTGISPAETPPRKSATPATAVAIKETEPPLGTWTDQKTELAVYIKAGKSEGSEMLSTERRHLELAGPPPSRNKADDVFTPEKYERRGNSFFATGTFNWDTAGTIVELEIAWTSQSVTIKIVKNSGYPNYPVGTYVLTRRKNS